MPPGFGEKVIEDYVIKYDKQNFTVFTKCIFEGILTATIDTNNENILRKNNNLIKNEKNHGINKKEYHPRMPNIYAFPRTHKNDTQMRPISTGIKTPPQNGESHKIL